MQVYEFSTHEVFKDVKVTSGQILNLVNIDLIVDMRNSVYHCTCALLKDFEGQLRQVEFICAVSGIEVACDTSCVPAANRYPVEVETTQLLILEQQWQVGADAMTQKKSEPPHHFGDGSGCTLGSEATFELGLTGLGESDYETAFFK